MSEKLDLDALAGRVSDGKRIDWRTVEAGALSDEDRVALLNLRLLEDVSRVHRSAGGDRPADEVAAIGPESRPPLMTWGSLELRGKIAEGGFGEVYRAWDPRLDREVALKLLKLDPSSPTSLASTMLREGRLLARVAHRNVVSVYGAETHDGRVGLWMELVRGRSLDELVESQGPFGAKEAMLIGLDLCRALAAVHGAGLVHRDVKASNVMRQEGGRIVLMDFGAGRELEELEQGKDTGLSGTPLYLPPEACLGKTVTARADIYSLGVLLFHLVTHEYPVKAGSLTELRAAHLRRESRLLRDLRPDLPEAFVTVVERALAWEPEGRFSTAGEMERALSIALGVEGAVATADPAPGARDRGAPIVAWAAIAALGLVAALVLSNLGWFRTSSPPEQAGLAGPAGASDPSRDRPLLDSVPPVSPPAGAKSSPSTQARLPGGGAASGSAADLYMIQASVLRLDKQGRRNRLDQGAKLALGDWISLDFQASTDLYLYVINEDENGKAYALFPLPDLDLQNPLPGGLRHEIPGRIDGKPVSWEVDSPGGREHLMLLASPERLVDFESEMARLTRPQTGQLAVPIPNEVKSYLRGIGGLSRRPETAEPVGSIDRLFEMAQRLAGESDLVRGAWLRRFDLENPTP